MMTTFALALALALQPGQQGGPPGGHTLGKTMQEVVAMGRDGWFTYYTEHRGDSTAAMSEAEQTYGVCLTYINSQKIEKLDRDEQRWYDQLRAQLAIGEEKSVTCAFAISGGGTIWTPVMAGSTADVEEVVQDLLTPRKDMPKAKQTAFWQKLTDAFDRVDKSEELLNSEHNVTDITHAEAYQMVREVERAFSNTVPLIRNKPQAERERVMAAFVAMLETVLIDWSS